MGTEEELEGIEQATLNQLGLPPVDDATNKVEVVATVIGPRELEAGMRESIPRVLAQRIRREIAEKLEGRTPAGYVRVKVDHSDHANCEGLQGQQVNAFIVGERCYRIVLVVAG